MLQFALHYALFNFRTGKKSGVIKSFNLIKRNYISVHTISWMGIGEERPGAG